MKLCFEKARVKTRIGTFSLSVFADLLSWCLQGCDNKRSVCFTPYFNPYSAMFSACLAMMPSLLGEAFVVRALMRVEYRREDFSAQTISEKSRKKFLLFE
jgi:hypothetical protein